MEERLFLFSAVIGLMLSLALLIQSFSRSKVNLFLGLILFVLSMELFFSWGGRSGYNNNPGAFPFQLFLSYHVFPASIYLFTLSVFNPSFKLKRGHIWLFTPAIVEIVLYIFTHFDIIEISLMQFNAWIWFIAYIPLIGFGASLIYFWSRAFLFQTSNKNRKHKIPIRYYLLMGALTLVFLQWTSLELFGLKNFYLTEIILVAFLFVFAFLVFLDSSGNEIKPSQPKAEKQEFQYDDKEELKRLEDFVESKKPYINPDLTVSSFSKDLKLPSRYVSYLINTYYETNFNEFINRLRIDLFVDQVKQGMHQNKTILALALDSGFKSKSTFNQAFKTIKGITPSEFLRDN